MKIKESLELLFVNMIFFIWIFRFVFHGLISAQTFIIWNVYQC